MVDIVQPPSPRPCESCPYRRDVASAIWDPEEYDKLSRYDGEMASQPQGVFLCHQHNRGDVRSRICGGWLGCHGPDNLLGIRLAILQNRLTGEDLTAVLNYESPIPLFSSGADAATHGGRDISHPSSATVQAITKIVRRRADLD